LEVEAGKSTVEVPSSVTGKVAQVLVKKGESIKTGHLLFLVEADGARPEPKADKPAAEAPRPRREERPPERAPAGGNGESKAPAPPSGPAPARAPAAATAAAAPPAGPTRLVPASPATRLLARQLGVDLGQVHGSAPHGRVTQEDVKAFVRQQMKAPARGGIPAPPPLPDFERWGPVERKPLDGVRRRTAEQMSLAWSQVPHVTQHDLADITDLDAFRRQQSGKGTKLTVTAFVLKGAAIALRQFPQFNASIDLAGGQLVFKQYYHIGVAVDTERGLLVPVLRDVDKKSVHMIAQELGEIAERARQKKLTADAMTGGTFTVTNLGGIGGTAFTPIVNWPEVAILGLSRATLQPVVRDGQIVPRLLLPLSLSYDHRVIDGADAARFTRRLAEMLENPLVMLLDA
jgi:pyruvate dehydrogenase E2 component (dihydrolipoamide acetyltransferase)